MTDREIEQRLKQAVEASVPDVLESVMARCDDQKGQVIKMPKKKNIFMKVAAIAASLALVLGISLFAFSYFGTESVATVVTLDVNPSIELKLDKNARVLEANALNDDAARVLSGMELKDTDLATATNAIIGSLLKNGYLHELANAILISVEDEDSVRGAQLQERLSREVDDLLSAASLNAAVLSQYVTHDVEALSNEYEISHGKAALIEQLLTANPSYSFEALAGLSVQELSLLMDNPKNEVKSVSTTGTASDSAYIGKDKAKAIAFEAAGIVEADVFDLDVDFDYEQGILVYEVDFDCGRSEYEYDINAVSGEIVHSRVEEESNYNGNAGNSNESTGSNTGTVPVQPDTATDIGEEKAKSIAFAHAGTTEAEVTRLYVHTEYDDGRLEYHVDFHIGTTEYEYEISAATGNILDYDMDTNDDDYDDIYDDDGRGSEMQPSSSADPATQISEEEAKRIALAHAGIAEADASGLRVTSEYDDGRLEYQVDFRVGSTEYEYEILAANGSILDYDKDTDD